MSRRSGLFDHLRNRAGGGKIVHGDVPFRGDFVRDPKIGDHPENT